MSAISFSQWILAVALIATAVLVPLFLARVIRQDGFGTRPAPDLRSDWGTPTRPSLPYSSRL